MRNSFVISGKGYGGLRFLAVLFLISGLLLTAGCAAAPANPTEDTPAASVETKPAEPTEDTGAAASLVSLRQAMVETPQLFAVAYLGYHETLDSDLPVDPYEAMRENACRLCEDLPFLLEIPQDRVVGSTGDLFCVVPLDENATVVVSKGTWDDSSEEYIYEESLYFRESGEPILLFCNYAGWEPDTQLYISGPSGEVIWYPRIDDNLCAMPLTDDNGEARFYDFSPYWELLMTKHRNMKGEWVMPTAEMLAGTSWVWKGYRKDGLDTKYRVSFGTDTLTVHWDDGLDEYTYEYPDASWELTYDEGFAVLSIDFQEFAGVLRYNLLYHEDYDQLYVALDAVQESPNIGWEPLYRFLAPNTTPEPMEMLGVWELAWTEVEGHREEIEPETEYITIFLNDQDVMRITLDDMISPQNSFLNKELVAYDGEMFPGCGNDQWVAYVGYMGAWDTIYSVTLPEDGMLLMELYWEIDGGVPMVAHKGYRRIG